MVYKVSFTPGRPPRGRTPETHANKNLGCSVAWR